ncbi:MAG: hypothetical protein ABIO49_01025 [Dokdonella sp.]
MPLLRDNRWTLALASALLLLSGASFPAPNARAAVDVAPIHAGSPHVQSRGMGEIDSIDALTKQTTKKPHTLRCWQEGLLILEREVDDLPQDATERSVNLHGASDADGPMRLYDLRNAVCLIQ